MQILQAIQEDSAWVKYWELIVLSASIYKQANQKAGFYYNTLVSRSLIGRFIVVNKSPDNNADTSMSRFAAKYNETFLYISKYCGKNKFSLVSRGVDSYLPQCTSSHGQN